MLDQKSTVATHASAPKQAFGFEAPVHPAPTHYARAAAARCRRLRKALIAIDCPA